MNKQILNLFQEFLQIFKMFHTCLLRFLITTILSMDYHWTKNVKYTKC